MYKKHEEIARHERFGRTVVNSRRTEEAHLPIPLKQEETIDSLLQKAKEIGPFTFKVVEKMFEDAKVKAQPALDVMAILSTTKDYPAEAVEKACKKALSEHLVPSYSDVRKHLSRKDRVQKVPEKKDSKYDGIVRGADYYKGGLNR